MRLKHAVILVALSEPRKNTPDNLARCGSMAIEQASADKCSAAALFIAAHRRRVHVYDGMVKRADDYGLAVGVDDRAEELGELKSGEGSFVGMLFPLSNRSPADAILRGTAFGGVLRRRVVHCAQ